MHSIWQAITDMGDAAVALPLALVMAISLLLARRWRSGLVVALGVSGCAVAVAGLKLALLSCGQVAGAAMSPSGHAALGVAVYGLLATVVEPQSRPARALLWLGVLALAAAIGVSRVVLGAHTPAEVVAGMTVAGMVVVACRRVLAPPVLPRPLLPWRVTAACLVGVLLLLHGRHWTLEPLIRQAAVALAGKVPSCAARVAAAHPEG